MRVSIITATYNSSAYIADCIKSVNEQTYKDIEHIIIDGASKDNTLDIIKGLPNRVTKIVSERDKGIYDAMNKGISIATGNLIGILNSDDFFTDENVVSNIVNEFTSNTEIEGVYSNLFYVKPDMPQTIVRHWISKPFKTKSFFYGWHPPHPTLYLKSEVYVKYGQFDLDFALAADFELMLRFFERYNIKTKYIDITTIRMRLGGATSKNLENVRKQNIECIEAFKKNEFKAPVLYPIYRLFPKLLQYFKRW
ncbi:MAG: glycosyltransferase family 2 protein [Tissierellia bacterium]|nr:glycosyltransferase family 2 protein [Tissierellia bacterium]